MKKLIIEILRKLAYWSLNKILGYYMKRADTDKNGELSSEEIKASLRNSKQIKAFLNKFDKK